MECWSIPVATYSEVNGTRVPTNPVYWVARRAFPFREAVTGARTSTMTGNPMSEANMISIGARSMDFWALTETEELEPEKNLDGFSRSSASFSVMISEVFSVRERKMIPVSAPWKNPAAERVSDLMDSSRPSFSMTLDISEWMERLISDFSCSGVPAEDPETLVTTIGGGE